jgi:superfamily II DNA or RNA helicase
MPKASLPRSPPPAPGPWLKRWLTEAELREVAGQEACSRGQALVSSQRVLKWHATPEVIRGEVRGRGGVRHQAFLSADAEGLICECQCARFLESGSCEHVVALGLSWLQATAPERPRPARKDSPEAPPPSEVLPPAEVPAWLEANHLTHLRRVSLAEGVAFLPRGFVASHGFYFLADESVAAVLEGKAELPDDLSSTERQQLVQAAWALARTEAERVRQGLAWERQASWPPPPTDARLEPLVQELARLRAQVREHAVPRALRAEEFRLFLSERPPLAVHSRESWPGRAGPILSRLESARLRLLPLLEGEAQALTCACTPQGPARCVHALSLVDGLLTVLADARRKQENAALAEQLFVRPGRKLLEALDTVSLLARPQRDSLAGPHVSFRLEFPEQHPPRLRPYVQRPLKRGGLSKGSLASLFELEGLRASLSSPEEQQALELSRLGLEVHSEHQRRPLLLQALKLLAHSPRLVLATRPDTPLQVGSAPLGFDFEELEEAGGGLRVRPRVGEVPVPSGALRPALERKEPSPWLFLEPEVPRVTLVAVSEGARALLETVVHDGGLLPASARAELLRRLGSVEAAFPLSLPASLEAREVAPEPGLLVRLSPLGGDGLEGELLVRPLPEAAPQVPGEGVEVLRGLRQGERVRVRRELEAERAEAAALLERLGLPVEAQGRFSLHGGEATLGFLERLEPLVGPGLRVEWPEARPWTVRRLVDARGLTVKVERKRDWFGVEGGLEVDGERVELAVLLEALRRGQRYVALKPGQWLRLTEALREQLSALADLAHPTRGGWEVSAAAAPVLDGLAEAGVEVEAPPDWRRLATRIRRAQSLEVPVPEGLRAELRDYQREGFVWMARLAEWGGGGCLADDMGLGKTLQALALLLHRAKAGPALVVAPTSVCFNWEREAARFAPSLRVHGYHAADREALLSGLRPGEVVVASYALLTREVARFAEVPFATLVLDEAQAVKNPDTARARAVRALQAEVRMALSGTPVENRLSELWSLYQLVFPGLLGSREAFRERFIGPIEREKDARARTALARVVRPFLLRRTKAEVARELPARLETVAAVSLSEGERHLYEDVRLAALARLKEASGPQKRFEVLAALTRLRLAACHPRLVDADSPLPSSKLERLLALLEAARAEGGRALVFSQFVKHLTLVREALEARGVVFQYLDGQTPAPEREVRVAAFQRGEGEVFLISLKAGGTGLNLTAADHVFHLDPWWNPAVEDQATDRAHRIGQTKPVTVTRLISEGTIEEAILEEKRDLATSLLSEADGAAALSTEQLLALLRYGPETEEGKERRAGHEMDEGLRAGRAPD